MGRFSCEAGGILPQAEQHASRAGIAMESAEEISGKEPKDCEFRMNNPWSAWVH